MNPFIFPLSVDQERPPGAPPSRKGRCVFLTIFDGSFVFVSEAYIHALRCVASRGQFNGQINDLLQGKQQHSSNRATPPRLAVRGNVNIERTNRIASRPIDRCSQQEYDFEGRPAQLDKPMDSPFAAAFFAPRGEEEQHLVFTGLEEGTGQPLRTMTARAQFSVAGHKAERVVGPLQARLQRGDACDCCMERLGPRGGYCTELLFCLSHYLTSDDHASLSYVQCLDGA